MATIAVQYTQPGLLLLRSRNLEVQFTRGNQAHTLRLDLAIHVDEQMHGQAAEDFYIPIFLDAVAETIRGYFGGMHQAVTVFEPELRLGFRGSAELLGKKRDEFAKTLGPFRQQILQALATYG